MATFTSWPITRVGTIPVTYDAQRKKMLWYYFMAASMKEKEMVRPRSLHAITCLHAPSPKNLYEGEGDGAPGIAARHYMSACSQSQMFVRGRKGWCASHHCTLSVADACLKAKQVKRGSNCA